MVESAPAASRAVKTTRSSSSSSSSSSASPSSSSSSSSSSASTCLEASLSSSSAAASATAGFCLSDEGDLDVMKPTDADGRHDRREIEGESGKPLWHRFYAIKMNSAKQL